MSLYHVEFAIEVHARSHKEACRKAWATLTGPDAMLPVGTVLKFDGIGWRVDVDLQELAEREKK